VCTGLAHLHRANLAHGALRPACVLMPDAEHAKGAQLLPVVFCPAVSLRDPTWLSPEQLKGETDTPTPATDIWSLGCLVMELVTGRSPWSHIGTSRVVASAVARHHPWSAKSLLLPKLPRRVTEFVARCLQLRDERPTPEALLADPWLSRTAAAQLVARSGISPLDSSIVLWDAEIPLGERAVYRYDGDAWWTKGPGSSVLVRGGSAAPLSLVVKHGAKQGSVMFEPKPGLVVSALLSSPGPVAMMPVSEDATYQWMARKSTRHAGAYLFESATRPCLWLVVQDGTLAVATGSNSDAFEVSSAFRFQNKPLESPPLSPQPQRSPRHVLSRSASAGPAGAQQLNMSSRSSLQRSRPAPLCPDTLGISRRSAATPKRAGTLPPPSPPVHPMAPTPPPSAPAETPRSQRLQASPGFASGLASPLAGIRRVNTTYVSPRVGPPVAPQRTQSQMGGGRSGTSSQHLQGSGRSVSAHPSPHASVHKLEQRMVGLEKLVEQGQDAVVQRVAQQVAQLLGIVKAQPQNAWPASPPAVAPGPVQVQPAAPNPTAQPSAPLPGAAGVREWSPSADYDLYCVQPIIISR